jgi:beta-glucosidase
VRWSGKIVPPESGKYLLGFSGNGGVRLFLDGKVYLEDFANRRTRSLTKEVELEGGRKYDVRLDYQENANHNASARLVWASPSGAKQLREDAISKARQADVVVMVTGISPSVEGEEMEVKAEGFRGGDRTDISLPRAQEDLIKDIHALGKPIVLVLLGGSALAVNWADQNVGAILDAWYPGEEGGTAIADVLFGDYNPSGRLPVTFYKSVDQLPAFDDYRMDGRTYRYFKGEPLYPFGFGLSYTQFKYGNLKFGKNSIASGESIQADVDVQNIGAVAGDEVVQLYLTDVAASFPVPVRALAGIGRVSLKPGEKRSLSFTITAEQMSLIDDRGKRIIEPGRFLVTVGGKQPGFKGSADAATTDVISAQFVVQGQTTEVK